MAEGMLERDDLSVYVIAGVPRNFKRKLQTFVKGEAKSQGDVMLLDEELAEWVIARLRGEKRQSRQQTPASAALWRAYRALSAARYHLQHQQPEEERVRQIRDDVEELWRTVSPMFDEPEEQETEEEKKEEKKEEEKKE